MVNGKALFCVVLVTAWCEATAASISFLPLRLGSANGVSETISISAAMHPAELMRARVREGVPPPLCVGRCSSPPAGPVCAFDAAGTARTFETICELEAVSCRESTYYAITSLGEC